MRTLAGRVFDRLGRLPPVGDVTTIDDVELRVQSTEGSRITALRVTLLCEHMTAPAPPSAATE